MEKSDFLKKLKDSLESGQANDDVNNLHYDILTKSEIVNVEKAKEKLSGNKPEGLEEIPQHEPREEAIQRIKRENGIAHESDQYKIDRKQKKEELERHAKYLNEFLKEELGDMRIVSGVDKPINNQSVHKNQSTLDEIAFLEASNKTLEAKIQENKAIIEYLKKTRLD